jgi:hypothetical protein
MFGLTEIVGPAGQRVKNPPESLDVRRKTSDEHEEPSLSHVPGLVSRLT